MSPRHSRKRQRGRGFWLLVCLAGVVALGVLGFGADALLHSRFFAATTVTVTGERHETVAGIEAASGLAHAPAMVSVDPGAIQRELSAAFPWIATVHVTKNWPHTVTVAITEHTPVAIVTAQGDTPELVDASGRLLGPPGPRQVLPLLEYAVAPHTPAPTTSLGAAATPGLAVAASLPPAFAAQVATVQVSSVGWVTLQLTTPVTFVLGPATDLTAKYEDVASVISGTTLHAGDVVDVSVPQAMTVAGP